MSVTKYSLSGRLDEDMFLTEGNMSKEHWEMLMGCYHQGRCDDDTLAALEYFEIKDIEVALECLQETGLDDMESKDNEELSQYYLWILSGDIQNMDENN